MIFWIENSKFVSYDQLLQDIKKGKSQEKIPGYNYFLKLMLELLEGYNPNSIDEIIKHFIANKDTLSFEIHTSGTTSTSKSIKVRMENCIRHVKLNTKKEKKVWGMGYPAGSFASTQVFFQSFINRETIFYLFGMNFNCSEKVLSQHEITNLTCTPTFLSMLLIHLKSIQPSVKKITTGGEKITENLIQLSKNKFINAEYINIYASTETGSLLYSNTEFFSIPDKYKHLLKIEGGTLHVQKSLLNSIQENEQENEWFNTNDIVEWIDHSQFRFVSRSNGYLNTGGYRISPSEIEETLLKINNIIDVHVYGKPNSLLGTIVCADVIGKNIDSKNIKKEMMKITDKQKIPQVIRVVESFEHVSNGKKRLMI